ncbi:hypothetical protein, partial [Salmonella sp. SAL4457]|uniref:hypothetical protein n=1 Tax=Salmonella sp. SAL4457 TaxID=3159912 RepID=UPI00397B6666
REVVDPQLARLSARLRSRGALADRFVVVTADHGHTQVRDDERHALAVKGDGDAIDVLKDAGFRVRPLRLEVSDKDDFQAVLAYQG